MVGAGVARGRARAGGDRVRGRGFLPEIQGLRGVAILLVMVYHVWFLRVSGGVDVFYVISGLLITGSLVRSLERNGRLDLVGYVARLVKRLFPVALLVLVAVLVATPLLLPSARWAETVQEAIASALYFENWQLAANSVDYLASRNAASPVQHYWSLGVQGQFYLLWPVLLGLAVVLGSWGRKRVRGSALTVLGVVLAASLIWSIVETARNQPLAYFDTFTRLWEFAIGGIVGLLLPKLALPGWLRVALGWLGIVGLAVCGLLIQGSSSFPGYAALLPTLAAAAVIVAGTTGSRAGVDRFLNTRAMQYLGDLSYSLYLWHWPLLIFYLVVTGRSSADLPGGVGILLAAVGLAAATKWLVEDRVPGPAPGRRGRLRAYAVGAAWMVPVLIGSIGFSSYLTSQEQALAAAPVNVQAYPGPTVLADPAGVRVDRGVPVRPDPLVAAEDKPIVLKDACAQGLESADVITCEYGELRAPAKTVAVVGGSHTEHWMPALLKVAEQKSWKLVTMLKRGCLLSTDPQMVNGAEYLSCAQWNDNVLATLDRLRPDGVFTLSTSTREGSETLPAGNLEQWAELDRMGIGVLAVRDTPRFTEDVPECVGEAPAPEAPECGRPRAETIADRSPTETLADPPRNVVFLDMNEYFCPDERCPAVIGNVLVYRDADHITATYARLLGPMLAEQITERVGH